MKRGLIWARVSEDKGQDVAGQVRELRRLAERLGVEVPEELVVRVEGESVFKGDPPEKREVMELARRRRFDVLLVWSLDRWARRRKDGAREVFDVLPVYGVTVVSHEEAWLSTETLPAGIREGLAHFALWIAEEESARKSRRVKLRYETNRARAGNLGARARWGRGVIASAEDRAQVVALGRRMSARAVADATGIPRTTVGRILAEAGVVQTSGSDAGSISSRVGARSKGALGPSRGTPLQADAAGHVPGVAGAYVAPELRGRDLLATGGQERGGLRVDDVREVRVADVQDEVGHAKRRRAVDRHDPAPSQNLPASQNLEGGSVGR